MAGSSRSTLGALCQEVGARSRGLLPGSLSARHTQVPMHPGAPVTLWLTYQHMMASIICLVGYIIEYYHLLLI